MAGALLAVLFPALTIRMFGHTALAANWLILLALYLWLCGDTLLPTTRRACAVWAGMGILCGGTHLYYLPMVGIILVGFAVRRALQKRGAAAVLLPVFFFCLAAAAEIFLLGAFASNFAGYSNGYLLGADWAGFLFPSFTANWEQDVYPGAGVLLAAALAGLGLVRVAVKRGLAPLAAFCRAHRGWLISGGVLLLLDVLAAGGNEITFAGHTLFTLPLPQFFLDFWSMFSCCARLGWVAGLLLTVFSCGGVLRLWGPRLGAALLTVCVFAQLWGERALFSDRMLSFHDDANYTDQTLLTDERWETVVASGGFAHLSFASFDPDCDEFWDFAAFAADHDWSVNSFYLAHMDRSLATDTLPGEMAELSPDTLYVFLQLDGLTRSLYPLHYYRLDGFLLGSVEPLALPEELSPTPCSFDFSRATLSDGAALTDDGAVRLEGGSHFYTCPTNLFAGSYTVTLLGCGFDQSYIYCDYGEYNTTRVKSELTFTEVSPTRMTFQVYAYETLPLWCVCVHTLGDAEVTVEQILITRQ